MTDLAAAAGSIFHQPDGQVEPVDTAERIRRPAMVRQARSMTAAARRIDTGTREGRKQLRKPDKQAEDVWTMFRDLGEVKFIGRFYGNAMSRIVMYPGVTVDPADAPVPVLDAADDPEIGLPGDIAEECIRQTERLTSGADGMAGIMRGFGEKLALVGDSYLCLRAAQPDDPVLGEEVAEVYSTSALHERNDRVTLQERRRGPRVDLPEDTVIYRVWRRDAQWPGEADSNLFAVLDRCEELLIWERYLRATGRSGTNAGALLIPSELDFQEIGSGAVVPGAGPGDPPVLDPNAVDAPPGDDWTALELGLMRSLLDGSMEDDSRAALIPHFLRGRAEWLEKVRHLRLERPIDAMVIERMEFLIRRIAHGADLPVEVLTGVADANHWTGWQIEDSTYKAHIEPTASIPALGLAASFLRPALLLEGTDIGWARRITYGLDPSSLVVRPNRTQDAKDAFDRRAISWTAYRRYTDFPEGDAPDELELRRRWALERGGGGQELTIALMNPDQTGLAEREIEPPPGWPSADDSGDTSGNGSPPADDGDGGEGGGEPTPAARAIPANVTAAATTLGGLGEQLASIETRLRDRLTLAASTEMTAVLRRAGNRLRGAAQGTDDRDRVNGIDPESVGLILGAERAAELVDPDQLLAGAFDPLRGRWDAAVGAAEEDAATVLARFEEGAQVPGAAADDRDRGWLALSALLLALARTRLFAAAETGDGEVDTTLTVPAGIVRDALNVAGGSAAAVTPVGTASSVGGGGLLDGPRWRLELRRLNIFHAGYTWATGFPTHPFRPHQGLSGTFFADWQDPALTNAGRFPSTSHYYPGDHRGCQCSAIPTLIRQE